MSALVLITALSASFAAQTIMRAGKFARQPDTASDYERLCYKFWTLEWINWLFPKAAPTQKELSEKALRNKPPQTFDQRIKYTIGGGKDKQSTVRCKHRGVKKGG